MNTREKLTELYVTISEKIEKKVEDFFNFWENGSEKDIFKELVFCLFTPQSKAKHCWETVELLDGKGLLLKGRRDKITPFMNKVRFRNNKASYLVEARKFFVKNGDVRIREFIRGFDSPYEAREWFVKNIKGLGYKEASHFLRNIGYGVNLAILDRHILKNLAFLGVIDAIPKTLTKRYYINIENEMGKFAKKIKIPMSHLDLLLWYKETGEIFK